MEIGGNSQLNESQKKGGRRTWTKLEEEALLSVLEDIVARGLRCDNGSFKSGTISLIEKQLQTLCPNSGFGMPQESQYSPMSVNQTSGNNCSTLPQKKRPRSSGDVAAGLEKLAKSFDKMLEHSKEEMQMFAQAIKKKDESVQHEFVWGEITKLDLSVANQIKVLKLFAEQPWNVSALKSMDEAGRKEFIMTLLDQGSSSN